MKQSKQESLRRQPYILCFYKGNHITFLIAMLSTIFTAALNLWIAWVMQQIIDSVSGMDGALQLSTLVLFTVGIILLIIIFKAMRYVSQPRFIKRAMEQYKNYAFQKLTEKNIASFSNENTSSYISAFSNDAVGIEKNYLENMFEILGSAIKLVGSFVMMFVYSPLMTVVACSFFILPIGAALIAGNSMEKAERKISDRNEKLTSTLKDSLSGFAVIKCFKAESAIIDLFYRSNHSLEQAKCEKRKIAVVISALAGVAGVTAQLGTFLVGAYLALKGLGITPGILLVFIDLTANVIVPIQEMPEMLAARKAAVSLIDKLAEALDKNVRSEGRVVPKQLERGIEVSNLNFSYDGEKKVLQELSFQFETGKSYAIVGASGSGKSTLLNLLMASYSSYLGNILYDGKELRDINCDSLYDLVSMIQQNVFVFNSTIRDNITMFQDFPREEVDRAIELSGLGIMIAERGEDYCCGENGNGLSGGEKQRISIARSLLRKSSVLLVDEATAALDAQMAHQISNAILELHELTRIVVTHSMDERLLKKYDSILVLKNGRMVETGAFEELIAQKGYFYSLYTVSQ